LLCGSVFVRPYKGNVLLSRVFPPKLTSEKFETENPVNMLIAHKHLTDVPEPI